MAYANSEENQQIKIKLPNNFNIECSKSNGKIQKINKKYGGLRVHMKKDESYKIQVNYYQWEGNAGVKLYWRQPLILASISTFPESTIL